MASSNLKGHWSNHQWVELKAVNNGDWSGAFWEPEGNDKEPWVELDLGEQKKVTKAIIYERGTAVSAFEIQAEEGEQWKTVYTGTAIGNKAEMEIPGTEAQKFRLVLKGFSGVPGIYEIVLL